MYDVTIVIAAKNEEATIEAVVSSCRPFAREVVVVVDRAQWDRTGELAARAGARVLVDRGLGKGDALRCAIERIRTTFTLFFDADGSHNADDIPRLLAPLVAGDADHVSASRLMGGSSELHGGFDEFFRLAGSSFITACINRRFGVRLSDTQNGFRAIRTDLLRELRLTSNSTTIEQEMIMKTLGMGGRMCEVPSHERKRIAGTSHVVVRRVALAYVLNLVRHLVFTRYTAAPARSRVESRAAAHN